MPRRIESLLEPLASLIPALSPSSTLLCFVFLRKEYLLYYIPLSFINENVFVLGTGIPRKTAVRPWHSARVCRVGFSWPVLYVGK